MYKHAYSSQEENKIIPHSHTRECVSFNKEGQSNWLCKSDFHPTVGISCIYHHQDSLSSHNLIFFMFIQTTHLWAFIGISHSHPIRSTLFYFPTQHKEGFSLHSSIITIGNSTPTILTIVCKKIPTYCMILENLL